MQPRPDHYVLDDGSERWEVDHRLHRDDGPALVTPEGGFWYQHGQQTTEKEVLALVQAREAEALRQAMRNGAKNPFPRMKPIQFRL
jgi:hypothetical protein